MRCIICGNEEESSKEHIIPEALGNKNFITNKVCRVCNNKLGTNVDAYLTNNRVVKMVRKNLNLLGKKEKDIKVFPASLKDNLGRKFLFINDIPSVVTEVEVQDGIMKIKAQTLEEALQKAEKKLVRMGLSEIEIKNSLENYMLQNSDKSTEESGLNFSIQDEINIGIYLLAGVKIAYEFACEILDDSYFDDSIAQKLRAELYKAIYTNKSKIAECIDYEVIEKYASLLKEESSNLIEAIKVDLDKLDPPVNHICLLHDSADNKLICEVVLLSLGFMSFTILLSEDSTKYNMKEKCKIVVVLNDGSSIKV